MIFFCSVTAPKRFYKNAGVLNCDGKFEITLDNRKLKTPSGAVFQVTNEPLAIASMYWCLYLDLKYVFDFTIALNFQLLPNGIRKRM